MESNECSYITVNFLAEMNSPSIFLVARDDDLLNLMHCFPTTSFFSVMTRMTPFFKVPRLGNRAADLFVPTPMFLLADRVTIINLLATRATESLVIVADHAVAAAKILQRVGDGALWWNENQRTKRPRVRGAVPLPPSVNPPMTSLLTRSIRPLTAKIMPAMTGCEKSSMLIPRPPPTGAGRAWCMVRSCWSVKRPDDIGSWEGSKQRQE